MTKVNLFQTNFNVQVIICSALCAASVSYNEDAAIANAVGVLAKILQERRSFKLS